MRPKVVAVAVVKLLLFFKCIYELLVYLNNFISINKKKYTLAKKKERKIIYNRFFTLPWLFTNPTETRYY